MVKYSDEELADNRLGLKHRGKSTLEIVQIDTLVQHPGTPAYFDGRNGIDYRDDLGDEEEREGEREDE
jgi:hypothetical protein